MYTIQREQQFFFLTKQSDWIEDFGDNLFQFDMLSDEDRDIDGESDDES